MMSQNLISILIICEVKGQEYLLKASRRVVLSWHGFIADLESEKMLIISYFRQRVMYDFGEE